MNIVTRQEWLTARKELLTREAALTRARQELAETRRALPVVEIDKPYLFHGSGGPVGLPELFEGRRQLIVHHVMWLDDQERVCPRCTGQMNDFGHLPHLHQQDITLAVVSRGPQPQLEAYRQRMGWPMPCYSSAGSDFNYDFHVTLDDRVAEPLIDFRTRQEYERDGGGPWPSDVTGDLPSVSVFLRDGDRVLHTYSAFTSGVETLICTMRYLDLAPLGWQDEPV